MYRDLTKFLPEEILVYLRRSRSDDPSMTVEEVLEKHESILRDWMYRNLDAPVPEENWYREIVSGETIQDRAEFQKVLKLIESPKIKAVLCVECVRLSRGDLEDCGRIIKLLRYTNTHVITPQRSFNPSDEFDREGFERELKNGNYYLEYSKKLMRRGKDYAVQQGAFVASTPPYGYEQVRVSVGKKKLPTLNIVEEEAKVVRMIFDWYVNEDLGCQRIANRLDEMGIKPPRTNVWGQHTIRKILVNEHYIGQIRYYAHKMDYVVKDQEVTKKKVAIKDYQLFDGLHEAIIDEDLFNKAMRKKDKNPRVKYGTTMRNPLSSLLYCKCGHAMTFCYKRGVARFECPEQRRCKNASIDANFLLNEVVKALRGKIEDFSVELNTSNDDIVKKHEEKIASLEKRLKDIEYRELALWEKYTVDNMPKSVFDSLRSKYEAEKTDVEQLLKAAIDEKPQRIDYEERKSTFHAALEALLSDTASADAKNRLLKACIDRIDYAREGSVRVSEEDKEPGKSYSRGWLQAEPHIDIWLRV